MKACKNCRIIFDADICPNCKTKNFSDDWVGEIIIFNPEKSLMAKFIDIKKTGHYAIKVR